MLSEVAREIPKPLRVLLGLKIFTSAALSQYRVTAGERGGRRCFHRDISLNTINLMIRGA